MTKQVYLTIDDAPSDDMPKKLALLDELGVNACWFVLGANIEKRRDLLLRALERGDILANHSFNHPFFSKISFSKIKKQVLETDSLIQGLYDEAGLEWKYKYFRFPYGDNGCGADDKGFSKRKWSFKFSRIQKFLAQQNYQNPNWEDLWAQEIPIISASDRERFDYLGCYWTYDLKEWDIAENYRTPVAQEDQIIIKLRELEERSGIEILLIHDHEHSSNLFDLALRYMAHKNFEFLKFKQ